MLNPTGQLSQMDNIKTQRLRELGRRLHVGDTLLQAYEWVQQASQQGRFRGPVYGPIILEVQCQDPQHIKYLEQACSCMPFSFHFFFFFSCLIAC